MHGPYWALLPGKYKIELFGHAIDKSAKVIIDFLSDGATRIFYVRHLTVEPTVDETDRANEPQSVDHSLTPMHTFDVTLDRQVNDFEIRCLVRTGSMELTRVNVLKKTLSR